MPNPWNALLKSEVLIRAVMKHDVLQERRFRLILAHNDWVLLKPGRKYEQAVNAFEPYDRIKEENPEARAAGKAPIAGGGKAAGPRRRTFGFVNDRLEGTAISTIGAMIQES